MQFILKDCQTEYRRVMEKINQIFDENGYMTIKDLKQILCFQSPDPKDSINGWKNKTEFLSNFRYIETCNDGRYYESISSENIEHLSKLGELDKKLDNLKLALKHNNQSDICKNALDLVQYINSEILKGE